MSQDKSHSIKIEFEDNDYLPYLYGHHNSNLAHIEKALDVTLDSFGNIIQITGSRDNAATAKHTIEALYRRIANDTAPDRDVSVGMVKDALRWASTSETGMKAFANADDAVETWRKTVTAKSAGQHSEAKWRQGSRSQHARHN